MYATITDPSTAQEWRVDLLAPADASIPVAPYATEGPGAFGLPRASAAPVRAGEWVGSVDKGASVNCSTVTLCAHANGTHTECVGHALGGQVTLQDVGFCDHLLCATLLTVVPQDVLSSGDPYPSAKPGDVGITRSCLEAAAAACVPRFSEAFVLRTAATEAACASLRTRTWSGSNPPYVTGEAMRWLLERGCRHVLVDLPSVDREDDGGHLVAHSTFWGLAPKADRAAAGAGAGGGELCSRTITELVCVPAALRDGPHLLSLQVAPLAMDAAPSRPLLFPALEVAKKE